MIARLVMSIVLVLAGAAPPVASATKRPGVPACTRSHVARSGDSWWSISQRHRVPLQRVLRLNSASLKSLILVGDRVCLQRAPGGNGAGATTTSVPPQTVFTRREVIQIIRDEWPDDLEERALAIAQRESNLRPTVVGGSGKCCYGLFQIYYRWHRGWLAEMGVTDANQLLDPRTAARAAYRLYQRNGWGPWE